MTTANTNTPSTAQEALDTLRSLISVVEGYQNMPGFSVHPMVQAQLDNSKSFLKKNT